MIIFISMLSCVLFVAHEVDHDCIGEDCHICAEMQVYVNSMKNTLLISGMVFAIACALVFFYYIICNKITYILANTLISLKIKLTI